MIILIAVVDEGGEGLNKEFHTFQRSQEDINQCKITDYHLKGFFFPYIDLHYFYWEVRKAWEGVTALFVNTKMEKIQQRVWN